MTTNICVYNTQKLHFASKVNKKPTIALLSTRVKFAKHLVKLKYIFHFFVKPTPKHFAFKIMSQQWFEVKNKLNSINSTQSKIISRVTPLMLPKAQLFCFNGKYPVFLVLFSAVFLLLNVVTIYYLFSIETFGSCGKKMTQVFKN